MSPPPKSSLATCACGVPAYFSSSYFPRGVIHFKKLTGSSRTPMPLPLSATSLSFANGTGILSSVSITPLPTALRTVAGMSALAKPAGVRVWLTDLALAASLSDVFSGESGKRSAISLISFGVRTRSDLIPSSGYFASCFSATLNAAASPPESHVNGSRATSSANPTVPAAHPGNPTLRRNSDIEGGRLGSSPPGKYFGNSLMVLVVSGKLPAFPSASFAPVKSP